MYEEFVDLNDKLIIFSFLPQVRGPMWRRWVPKSCAGLPHIFFYTNWRSSRAKINSIYLNSHCSTICSTTMILNVITTIIIISITIISCIICFSLFWVTITLSLLYTTHCSLPSPYRASLSLLFLLLSSYFFKPIFHLFLSFFFFHLRSSVHYSALSNLFLLPFSPDLTLFIILFSFLFIFLSSLLFSVIFFSIQPSIALLPFPSFLSFFFYIFCFT